MGAEVPPASLNSQTIEDAPGLVSSADCPPRGSPRFLVSSGYRINDCLGCVDQRLDAPQAAITAASPGLDTMRRGERTARGRKIGYRGRIERISSAISPAAFPGSLAS